MPRVETQKLYSRAGTSTLADILSRTQYVMAPSLEYNEASIECPSSKKISMVRYVLVFLKISLRSTKVMLAEVVKPACKLVDSIETSCGFYDFFLLTLRAIWLTTCP